jgi:hypothetical protein
MTNLTTDQVETIKKAVADKIKTDLSPYAVAKVASDVIGRYVREQVVYSYVRQGFLKAHKDSRGHWVVSRDVAVAWVTKYVLNNIGK